MDLQILANAADDVSAMETESEVGSPEEIYEIVDGGSLDFDSWTSLMSEIEKTYSDDIKAISSVYDSFLARFPLCHEYWKKYADHNARLCTMEKAVEIFEQAVQSATYSVGLWVDYCSFSILAFADPSDIRRIFECGLSFVGKDFLCHKLWDLYIRFELSQQQWSLLARILIRALKFPTKSLHKYYDNFREFAAFVEEDMSFSKSGNLEPFSIDSNEEDATSNDEIFHAIKELQDSSSVEIRSKALYKLTSIGEQFYHKSCQMHEEIDYFENYMERDFFHVEPIDDEQLENWHNYLDFIEKQDDFDWAVKLYERCLIPCANYPEFWMRYVEFMESKGGRELANFALERATQVFLKNVSELHIFNARFREKIGDIEGARAALLFCDAESDSSFIETAINKANMEKRLGNMDTALDIYDIALKMAAEKEKMDIIPILYIHLFRLKYHITGSADAAVDLLITGIQQVSRSRLLIEELINFAMMHDGSKHLDLVDPIIATAITCGSDESQGLSSKDREDLSLLYMKFVDYCGTTHDIRKAWNRHIKSFPHLIRSTSSHKNSSNRLSNELEKSREKLPRLVAKQPSGVRNIKHIAQNSVKENTLFQQSEDNAARELKRLKHQSKDDASGMIHNQGENKPEEEHEREVIPGRNELQVSQKCDQILTEPENPSITESAKKQNGTDEHESESSSFLGRQTDPQQIPASVHVSSDSNGQQHQHESTALTQVPNQDRQNHAPNVQPQNPSVSQPVQSMFQYPMQNAEQIGMIPNTEAYNQMWQYQYQQQQNQQQWLQMQQSYLMPQQYVQQQQYPMYQQQEQYQQYWYQAYQQQQLQEYTRMQQYQQMPQDLNQNIQHQITALANQMWNSSHDQQGQGTMPPHMTSIHTGSTSYMQQNSTNVLTQPVDVNTSTNDVGL